MEKKIKTVDETLLLQQSNEIIEANYKLSTAEQKVILNMIAQINNNLTNFERLRISAKSLSEACGFNPKSGYRQLQQVIKKLLNRSIILQRRDGSGWYGSHWVQSCDYIKINDGDEDCSYVEYELDERLCPHFLQLKERFLKSNLHDLISFKHVYSTRFYMIFKNRIKIGHIRYSFEELCKLLELPKSYKTSVINLKNKVIKVAVDEINEKSDITVNYAYYKKAGRAHVGVEFSFYNKTKIFVKPTSELPIKRIRLTDDEQIMYNRLTDPNKWNISDDVARKQIKNHSLKMLDANIHYAWKYRKGKINLGGWLISCLDKDYASLEAQRIAQQKDEQQRQHEKAQEQADILAAGLVAKANVADKKIAEQYEQSSKPTNDIENELAEIEAELICRKGSQAGSRLLNKIKMLGLTIEDVKAGKRK